MLPRLLSAAARHPRAALAAFLLLITAGLLLYSQTLSFVWDEGFHLIAAQLIDRGELPYIDFCFPQTPLNAYWNAGWMALFGQTWRVTHVVSALEVAAAVFLTAGFVFKRLPLGAWRLPCALVVACFAGLNSVVFQFGTVSQAYGVGMLLCVAAFRAAVAAVERRSAGFTFASGLLAGMAAGTTLLTAPMLLVFLIWLLFYQPRETRGRNCLAFIAGAVIPFAPVFWLFAKSPRQTWFNVVQYQAIFRRVNWKGATTHDVDVLSAWLNSIQVFLMSAFAVAGLVYIRKKSGWDRLLRAEFYLCAWSVLALVLYISTAHPTFQRYFVFAVPFAAILTAPGLYLVGTRLANSEDPFWPAFIAGSLVALALGRALFDDREAVKWQEYEQIARKVEQVTPLNAPLYADEQVYFLTRRPPPSGMEFSYSHKLDLPTREEALYHIISEPELKAQVRAGKFYTFQSCNDDLMDEFQPDEIFLHKIDLNDCSIYWAPRPASASAANKYVGRPALYWASKTFR